LLTAQKKLLLNSDFEILQHWIDFTNIWAHLFGLKAFTGEHCSSNDSQIGIMAHKFGQNPAQLFGKIQQF